MIEVKEVTDYINALARKYDSSVELSSPLNPSLFSSAMKLIGSLLSMDSIMKFGGNDGDSIQNFKEIMDTRFSGCSKEEMNNYITASNKDMYFNCLDLQKDAIVKLFYPSLNQDEQGCVGQSNDVCSD